MAPSPGEFALTGLRVENLPAVCGVAALNLESYLSAQRAEGNGDTRITLHAGTSAPRPIDLNNPPDATSGKFRRSAPTTPHTGYMSWVHCTTESVTVTYLTLKVLENSLKCVPRAFASFGCRRGRRRVACRRQPRLRLSWDYAARIAPTRIESIRRGRYFSGTCVGGLQVSSAPLQSSAPIRSHR